mmetsp:Transcript_4067/g.8716  ORF Transcript_4067/g.8716 Transcript_4067/m.8716 type:complete len:155 (-) Transcript_4067:44-508(-)
MTKKACPLPGHPKSRRKHKCVCLKEVKSVQAKRIWQKTKKKEVHVDLYQKAENRILQLFSTMLMLPSASTADELRLLLTEEGSTKGSAFGIITGAPEEENVLTVGAPKTCERCCSIGFAAGLDSPKAPFRYCQSLASSKAMSRLSRRPLLVWPS